MAKKVVYPAADPSHLCACPCHRHSSILHCVPCCYTCPNCHAAIESAYVEAHVATCVPRKKRKEA